MSLKQKRKTKCFRF